ncbi:hypothetical protein A4U49_08795 [Acidithiobacillus ferrivorans]|nr:hypothetical protein A4U49_08795 [Acidithiobacillus ferrivorans]
MINQHLSPQNRTEGWDARTFWQSALDAMDSEVQRKEAHRMTQIRERISRHITNAQFQPEYAP